jgi:hypothetical protein
VSLALSEQLGDLRARRVIYDVTVENLGPGALHIRSVSPRVGPQVGVSEVVTPADLAESDQVGDLCVSVERLLRLWLASVVEEDPMPPARRAGAAWSRRFVDRLAGTFSAFVLLAPGVALRVARDLDALAELPRPLRPSPSAADRRIDDLIPPLYDPKAAEHTVARFRETLPPPPPEVAAAFDARLDQLARLDRGHGRKPDVVLLPPDSKYRQTLELDFRRGWLNPRKHTVSIEVRYAEADDADSRPVHGDWRLATATEFVVISPNPVLLTLTTLVGAALGTVLHFAVADGRPRAPLDVADPFASISSNAGVTAAILALVFFNVFEFTSLAGRFRQYVNWRGALLVGVLCGLGGDKILQALHGILS